MTFRTRDGCSFQISTCRVAERLRKDPGDLTGHSQLRDLATLVDIESAEPGMTDFRLTGSTAWETLKTFAAQNKSEAIEFWTWLKKHRGEIVASVRRVSVPIGLQVGSVQTPPFILLLARRILSCGQRKATAKQWIAIIRSLKAKGIRAEEIERQKIIDQLQFEDPKQVFTDEMIVKELLDPIEAPRLVVESEFGFRTASGWAACNRTISPSQFRKRGLVGKPKLAVHTVRYRHCSMGWLIVDSEYEDLFMGERRWWTVLDHEGRVAAGQTFGFRSLEVAMQFAEAQIAERFHQFGREHFRPRWQRYSLAGGDNYCEFLVQLNRWRHQYQPRHFATPNVLIHIRSSVRETNQGKRVLFLDEVQSDWHSDLAFYEREVKGSDNREEIPDAPFRSEWQLLSLKLMLWHAQRQGLDGLAWSTAELQDQRWGTNGPPLLLYRKQLPEAARQLASGLGLESGVCQLPVIRHGHKVRPDHYGWAVFDNEGQRVAGPYELRSRAQSAAEQGTAGDPVPVPVVWLSGLPKLKFVPLWGVGQLGDWTQTSAAR